MLDNDKICDITAFYELAHNLEKRLINNEERIDVNEEWSMEIMSSFQPIFSFFLILKKNKMMLKCQSDDYHIKIKLYMY